MKKVISAVKASAAVEKDIYKTADTVNKENFPAWKLSEKEQLNQLAMCGTLANSFYATTKNLVDDAMELVKKADAKNLQEAIILGRNEGFIRSFNILGLVYLSQKDSNLFKDAFGKVVLTGNDLKDFIDTTNTVRGFGRSIKSAIHKWIGDKTTPFYALKYRREIADAIRVSRFQGEDPIYAFILKIYNVKNLDSAKVDKAYEKYGQLQAYEDVKKAVDAKEYDKAVKLVTDNKLDPTSLISEYDKFTGKVWDSVAQQMGVMLFLKYLNKLTREGVFERTGDKLYKEKLKVENLKKAKVFPFRLFIAHQHIEGNVKLKNHLADVLDDYVTKYDWEEWNKQSWAVCPDVSGSMTNAVQGSDMTPSVVAGMFSGFFYKGLDDCTLIPWDDSIHVDSIKPKRDSIISHINSIAHAHGGGTNMELPVQYMIQNKIKVDNAIFITDSMEWGEGWVPYWKEYRKKVNPKARAFLLRVDAYNSKPFSDKLAKDLDIYQLYGWNDNVLKFMEFIVKHK